jgi:hypothetical protein
LYATAAVLAAGAVVVVALGALLPLDTSTASSSEASRPTVTESALPSVASLEPLWDLRLRGDLAPAPASQQPARLASDVAPAAQGIPVSLVGTIGDSLAILRQESGQVDVRAAGENVAGVEVLDVRPARVRVRYNGMEQTLEKPPDARPGL